MMLNRLKEMDDPNFPKTPNRRIPRKPSAQDTWTGDYLKDLRTNRPSRPTGARPLPPKTEPKTPRASIHLIERAASAIGLYESPIIAKRENPERCASAMSIRQTPSQIAKGPREMKGMPLARPPVSKMRNVSSESSKTSNTTQTEQTTTSKTSNGSSDSKGQPYSIPYYERGQRWMEKQEMSSLRRALEVKDLEEDQAVYNSAQDEAADLVWKHQNPGVPYPNPEAPNLRAHLKQGSHARTLSNGPYENLYVRKGGAEGSRSASDGSTPSQRSTSDSSQGSTGSRSGRFSSLSFSVRSGRLFGSKKRNSLATTDGRAGIFSNPQDKIYEASEDVVQVSQDKDTTTPLKVKARNTSYGTKSFKDKFASIEEKSENNTPVKSIVDIYKNPPSQSRNAEYRINKDLQDTPDKVTTTLEQPENYRDGKEIRGDDIRAATSMSLKDRSPKLPMPTVVSDRPGRPIVSFQKDYKPRQKELQHEKSTFSHVHAIHNGHSNSAPQLPTLAGIPSINLPDAPSIQINNSPSIPSISFPDDQDTRSSSAPIPTISIDSDTVDIPSISVSSSDPSPQATTPSTRPLPQPSQRKSPFARPQAQNANRSSHHWTPVAARGSAQCSACALPIAGKIVSASSKRFHPHCFTCFCCGELLECVAFYPEPEKFRAERLARIEARLNGQAIQENQLHFSETDDGDDSLRFYCHLDFHEIFSPRCKSCKTPIEGQVIVACGAEWHVGHFFCAECGDPFDASMPFVEKDGFAWCVNCHTKRFSGKCAGCRKPITDLVVSALDKEWHVECFKCKECSGDFEDGRFFTRGEDETPVCVRCEERRLKA